MSDKEISQLGKDLEAIRKEILEEEMTNDNNPNDAPGLGGGGAGAGRKLDAKIAEKLGKVVHWADEITGSTEYAPLVEDEGSWYMGKATTTQCPYYSTDIAAAWELVEFIIKKYPKTDFNLKHDFYTKKPYRTSFEIISEEVPYEIYKGEAETGPLAICLAFLALPDEVVRGK